MLLWAILACGPNEAQVRDTIEAARACTRDDECESLGSACPFGCYIVVNRAQASAVEATLTRYRAASSGAECVYDCAAPGQISCTAGRCVMAGQ